MKVFQPETTFFITFLQGFQIFKILDIRLWEIGAKRRLNGTSKVNRQTHGHTHGHMDGHLDLEAFQNWIITYGDVKWWISNE